MLYNILIIKKYRNIFNKLEIGGDYMREASYLQEQLYKHRKSLNPIAEIGRKEYKTSKYIRDYLDKLGIEYEIYLETGIVGVIEGKRPKKILLLELT